MRAFVAIELDDEARSAVVMEQRRLAREMRPSSGASMRWVRPEHLHLTLIFFRDVGEMRVPALSEAMHADIDLPQFDIVFEELGVFPRRGAPQALWMALASGGIQVAEVQRQLVARAGALGVELEQRAFHPHLTLARWRRSRSSDAPVLASGSQRVSLRVDRVALIRSVLSAAGPSHDVLTRATLTGCRSSSSSAT